ncbi:MAG TPA: NADPH-dependent FMN reductase [Thermoanaerobaculia bacterium]|nr:NADPH-dependent FMN reductase [Thermoanaerobaculia bacterium]
MTTILGISGSLRRGSYNSMLLTAAAGSLPADATLEIASIRGIPLYDGDSEAADGIPPGVRDLKERIAAADGLLIATPEYNNSIPGVIKNAIDWLSRPPRDIPRVFGGLPVALMGATPGRGGTALAQAAWLPILRALGTRPWFGRILHVSGAADLFDERGLTDEETRSRLAKFVAGFAAFAAESRRPDSEGSPKRPAR